MMTARRLLAKNIAFLRKSMGMTQTDLAKKIGFKKSTVGAYEESRSCPSIDTIIKLSDLFSVSIDDLLKLDIKQSRAWQDELVIKEFPDGGSIAYAKPKTLLSDEDIEKLRHSMKGRVIIIDTSKIKTIRYIEDYESINRKDD